MIPSFAALLWSSFGFRRAGRFVASVQVIFGDQSIKRTAADAQGAGRVHLVAVHLLEHVRYVHPLHVA